MADDQYFKNETYTPQLADLPVKGSQKLINMFFLVDTSGSLRTDGRIRAINELFPQMILSLRKVQLEHMTDYDLRIAIMTFDDNARWIVPPTPVLEYTHEEIVCSNKSTFFSIAFRALREKLARNEYMAHTGKIAQPYIMLLTDGEPTHGDKYRPELDKLLANGWFNAAQRYAVLIGPEAIRSPEARAAVGDFVSDKTEGILCAANAVDIMSGVYVKTLHTISGMTQHKVDVGMFSKSRDKTYSQNQEIYGGFHDFISVPDNYGSGVDGSSGGVFHYQGNAADDSFGDNAAFGGTFGKWDAWADHGGADVLCCRNCNSTIAPGARFCPYCGYPVGIEQPDINMQNVEFSAIAPRAIMKGDSSVISIIMYEENSRYIVDELIRTSDEPVQDIRSGVYKVGEGSEVKIILSSRDITIENSTMTGIWRGRHLEFYFMIYLPDDYKKRDVLCSASVYINNVIASNLIFKVKCLSVPQEKIEISRKDVLSAFISYASQDRRRVALIIQGMKKIRPELDVFFDVGSLRSGDTWERVLPRGIEKRDVLYLFWSHFAKESEWVEKEWRYALKMKGDRYIEPFPLELPENCPPPDELKHKSFNDILLYVINAYAEKERK